MAAIGEEGVKVGSGGFRISREEALRKLQKFQLKYPVAFGLAWVRAACASGASRIDVEAGESSMSFRFDGRPLAPELFNDPVAGLLGSEGTDEAARHFGIGYLGAWRYEPQYVELESGGGPERRRLRAARNWVLEGGPPAEAGPGTVLRIAWAGPNKEFRKILARLSDGCGLADARVFIQGSLAPDRPADSVVVTLQGRRRGWLRRWSREDGFLDAAGTSRIVYRGTELDPVMRGDVFKLVEAALADDELTLDLSQETAVNNERLSEGLDLLDAAADGFLVQELHSHRDAYEELMRRAAADRAFLAEWSKALESGKGGNEAVAAADRLRWLREAALHDRREASPWRPKVRKKLLNAPLMIGAGGLALSVRRLGRLVRREGFIPYTTRPLAPGEASGSEPVWLTCRADRSFLEVLFPGSRLKDVTPTLWSYWSRRFLRRS